MSGWVIGYVIGVIVVLVVVAVLLLMIRGARQTAAKVEAILAALEEARDNSAALGRVAETNRQAERVVAGAARARVALGGGDLS
jgi:hypothetical protein